MSQLATYWRKLPRRARQAVVIGPLAIAVVLGLQQLIGSEEAQRAGEEFLMSHPVVAQQVGEVSEVRHVGRQDFSFGLGGSLGTFDFEAVGRTGALRAEVKVENTPSGGWSVYSATLFTDDGPIPLMASE